MAKNAEEQFSQKSVKTDKVDTQKELAKIALTAYFQEPMC